MKNKKRYEMPDRYFRDKRSVMKIGQLLKGVLPKRSASDRTLQKLRDAWRQVVGEEVFRMTKVLMLKCRVLQIGVESAVMIHYLTSFERNAIITQINDITGEKSVEDIKFRVGMQGDGGKN